MQEHLTDVGDMCIPGEFHLRGSSTLSSRSRSTDQGDELSEIEYEKQERMATNFCSTDQGRSVSSGDTNLSNLSDSEAPSREEGTRDNTAVNTALNTAFNKILLTPAGGSERGGGGGVTVAESPRAASLSPGFVCVCVCV